MLTPSFVQLAFMICAVATGVVTWAARQAAATESTKVASEGFSRFQKEYLVVFLLANFADWLQGPYVYALYASYGFSSGENALLFVAGFSSSMLFGTVVGSMADKNGRMRSAQLYCVLYIASCMTKHVSSFSVLMLGRILGGVSTSLLFSVFESWMVCEHGKRGFHPDLLGDTFGLAIFGNSLFAVVAGIVAEFGADLMPLSPPAAEGLVHIGGYVTPFDVSILVLIFCFLAVVLVWNENYGHQDSDQGAAGSTQTASDIVPFAQLEAMKEAAWLTWESPDILCCGAVVSLFEASMFIFVFNWTPAVTEPDAPKPPYGHIFATFMAACMLGSRIFSFAVKYVSIEKIGQAQLAMATCSHLVPLVTTSPTACFCAFLCFELCVGVYFPMIGTLKSSVVPEGSRVTIYNLYRVPMNSIVVITLITQLSLTVAFTCTSLMLGAALFAQSRLAGMRSGAGGAVYSEACSTDGSQQKDLELSAVVGASALPTSDDPIDEPEGRDDWL